MDRTSVWFATLFATSIVLAPLALAGHSNPGDVHVTASNSARCEPSVSFLPCRASAFLSVEHVAGDCQVSGCYFSITCLGTATGSVVVAGELVCGVVDVSGNVDPTIGSDACASPGVALFETSCSLSQFGRAYVFMSSCQLFGTSVAAESPAGATDVIAGPIRACVTPAGVYAENLQP